MTSLRVCLGIPASMALTCAAIAGQSLTPVDQARTVSAEAVIVTEDIFQDSQSDAATDFGPFNSSVTATAQTGPQPPRASATASQQSQINSDSLIGAGSATAQADAGFTINMSAHGSSEFSVAFSIAAQTEYLLTGLLDADSGPGSTIPPTASATLSGPGGDLYVNSISSGSSPLFSAGILDPGQYELSVFASAAVEESGHETSAAFDFNFSLIPEPSSLAGLALVGIVGLRRRQ